MRTFTVDLVIGDTGDAKVIYNGDGDLAGDFTLSYDGDGDFTVSYVVGDFCAPESGNTLLQLFCFSEACRK